MIRSNRLILASIVLLAAALLLGAVFFAALPRIVRAMPGRYAYYLPDRLQAWRHVEHPETLPTPIAPVTATPIPQPSATPTALPTGAPTAIPSPTPSPSPTPMPTPALPVSTTLTGLRHEPQGWNNCGPTTLAMALSFWGREETQREAAPALKPDPEDKNVSPGEMADYVRSLGLDVVVRVDGDLDLLKHLLASDFPVIVETWYVRDAQDQLGHYRLVVGYNDIDEEFLTYDSLHGPDLPIGYQELDELWRVFNRTYLVVYPPEREAAVAEVLGSEMDRQVALEAALETARQEAQNPPADCVAYADCADAETFAWFNVGSSLAALGRYEEAAAAFDQARRLGLHFRMLWYQFGPYEAYHAVGRYEDVIALANATLATTSNLEESYYWRGRAKLGMGDVEGARADFEMALRYHEGWSPAQEVLEALEAE